MTEKTLNICDKKLDTASDYLKYCKHKKDISYLAVNRCIVNELPNFKNHCNKLNTIIFSDCVFTNEKLLYELHKAKNLKDLTIAGYIGSLYLPKSLEKLTNLGRIMISNIDISCVNCDFNKIKSLEELTLHKNYLDGAYRGNKYFIVNSDKLKRLYITDNSFKRIRFDNCPNLEEINLNDNCLIKLDNNVFSSKKLSWISVRNNNISDLSNLDIKDLKHKVAFSFLDNPIKKVSKDFFLIMSSSINRIDGPKTISIDELNWLKELKESSTKELALGIDVSRNKGVLKGIHGLYPNINYLK